MKKAIFYSLFFVCSIIYGQNTPKTDTILSVKYNYDRIENSKMYLLTHDIKSKCKTKFLKIDRSTDLSYNLKYSILSILKAFNEFTKSSIFSDYKYFICSSFCYNCDFNDEITIIEFHYTQKSKVQIFKKKIEQIINDKKFFNYPNDKLFYYKILDNNVCYLLISIQDNANNEIFNELKNRIEKFR